MTKYYETIAFSKENKIKIGNATYLVNSYFCPKYGPSSKLVKNDISNIVQFSSQFEDEFVKLVAAKPSARMGTPCERSESGVDENYKRLQATQKKNLDTLNKMLARDKELDKLCEKVFEEKILGNLPEERFLKLSEKYAEEQFELKAQIKNMKKIVAQEKEHEQSVDDFLRIVRKYYYIEELTSDILHEFIDKIFVHHREELNGETIQQVEIYYKMIGHVQIPKLTRPERQSYIKTFGRTKKSRLPSTQPNSSKPKVLHLINYE